MKSILACLLFNLFVCIGYGEPIFGNASSSEYSPYILAIRFMAKYHDAKRISEGELSQLLKQTKSNNARESIFAAYSLSNAWTDNFISAEQYCKILRDFLESESSLLRWAAIELCFIAPPTLLSFNIPSSASNGERFLMVFLKAKANAEDSKCHVRLIELFYDFSQSPIKFDYEVSNENRCVKELFENPLLSTLFVARVLQTHKYYNLAKTIVEEMIHNELAFPPGIVDQSKEFLSQFK